jgi:hypothetical protein
LRMPTAFTLYLEQHLRTTPSASPALRYHNPSRDMILPQRKQLIILKSWRARQSGAPQQSRPTGINFNQFNPYIIKTGQKPKHYVHDSKKNHSITYFSAAEESLLVLVLKASRPPWMYHKIWGGVMRLQHSFSRTRVQLIVLT